MLMRTAWAIFCACGKRLAMLWNDTKESTLFLCQFVKYQADINPQKLCESITTIQTLTSCSIQQSRKRQFLPALIGRSEGGLHKKSARYAQHISKPDSEQIISSKILTTNNRYEKSNLPHGCFHFFGSLLVWKQRQHLC